MINAQYIAEALNGKPLRNGGYECDCPLTEHRRAKMVISDKDNGEPLIHCRAGCSYIELQRELKQRGLWPKKEYTPREKHEFKQKIERKAWENDRIWVAAYEAHPDKRTVRDEVKYRKLKSKYKNV